MIERATLRLIAICLGVGLIFAGIAYLIWHWQHSAKVEQRVQTGQAGAGMNSTEAAFNTMDAASKRDAEIDATVNAGKAAIDASEPGKRNSAAIKAACGLPAYKDSPKCPPKP